MYAKSEVIIIIKIKFKNGHVFKTRCNWWSPLILSQ